MVCSSSLERELHGQRSEFQIRNKALDKGLSTGHRSNKSDKDKQGWNVSNKANQKRYLIL